MFARLSVALSLLLCLFTSVAFACDYEPPDEGIWTGPRVHAVFVVALDRLDGGLLDAIDDLIRKLELDEGYSTHPAVLTRRTELQLPRAAYHADDWRSPGIKTGPGTWFTSFAEADTVTPFWTRSSMHGPNFLI